MKCRVLSIRLLILSCFFFVATPHSLKAQVTIPDPNFAAWLRANGYDSCMAGNVLDTLCSHFELPTDTLNLSYQNISDLTGLQYISWSDPNTNGYQVIDLSHNNFTEFPPALFPKINLINRLKVNLSYNHIDSIVLDQNYFNLYWLDASQNAMKVFRVAPGVSPRELTIINLNDNELDTFPRMYLNGGSGFHLSIRRNKLTSFPASGSNFAFLDCGANQITSFTWGYGYCGGFKCDSNLITSIDMSSVLGYFGRMTTIDCSHNLLTSFTGLNLSHLDQFICNDNNLTAIPKLPPNLTVLDCHNNPNLTCIPSLPNVPVFTFNYSNTDVQCLPRQFPNCTYNATPPINSVPTCDLFNNIYACPQYSNMEGFVYADKDSDCVLSITDQKLNCIKMRFLENGIVKQQTFTSGFAGHYSFDEINYGTYTIEADVAQLPISVHCPDTFYYTATVDSQQLYQSGFDFGMNCKPGFDVGISGGMPSEAFLPGHTVEMRFFGGDITHRFGLSCADGVSGQVRITFSGPVTYAGIPAGHVAPSSVSGNTLTWNIADFGASYIGYTFLLATDTLAQMNDQVCFTAQVTPIAGDNNPANNAMSFCDEVRSSFDPNDKNVYPLHGIAATQDWLTYTIRFQNTGNAPATHVVIRDTLDDNLDFNSFEMLNFSHPNSTDIFEDGAVVFNFPNINLPDSTSNEPESHGFIQYRIRLHENLPIGTEINNTAHIYFDYNAPVVTNTVTNTIALICTTQTYVQTASICQGDAYTFNGNNLSSGGNYSATFSNRDGCDSIVELVLSVTPDHAGTVDTAILAGTVYTFPSGNTATVAGVYLDTLHGQNSCDTLITVHLSILSSVIGVSTPVTFGMFPNPAAQSINIQIDESLRGSELWITDIAGKRITTIQLNAVNSTLETATFVNGVYFLVLRSKAGDSVTQRLLINK